jgi:hypothetical protein
MSNIDSIKSKPPGKGITAIPVESFRPKPKIKQTLTLPVSPPSKTEHPANQEPATQEPLLQDVDSISREDSKSNGVLVIQEPATQEPASKAPAAQVPAMQAPVLQQPATQEPLFCNNLILSVIPLSSHEDPHFTNPIPQEPGEQVPATQGTSLKKEDITNEEGRSKHRQPVWQAPATQGATESEREAQSEHAKQRRTFQRPSAENLTRRPTQTNGAFFMLNQAESYNLLHELDPFEFKLFYFLSLRAWGWDGLVKQKGDGTTRAAVGFICKGTNLKKTMVEVKLKSLLDKHLIQLIELSFKKGNLYRISNVLHSSGKPKEPAQQAPATQEPEAQAPSILPDSSLAPRQAGTNIDYRSLNLSLTRFLKPAQLTELETRWLSFMKKEREREEKGLLKLIQQKPDEAEIILKAFEIILKEQDEYGEIKSAISVLETNYTGQYRAKALAAIARLQEKQKQTHTAAEVKSKQTTDEDAEAQIQLIRMQCFEQAFPDLAIRKQYILNVCKDNPMFLKLGAASPIATSYAVTQWAQGEGSAVVLSALDRETTQTKN